MDAHKDMMDQIFEVKKQIDMIDLELRLINLLKILELKQKELLECRTCPKSSPN